MLGDTDPVQLDRYRERLRAMSPAQRLEIAAGLTRATRDLAEAGIRSRHPGASEAEVRWRFAALLYGPEIARRVLGDLPAGRG